jgi:type VI secretion system protein ImpH
MASADRFPSQPLTALQRLRQEPHRFSLFAALRLLEQLDPARPRLGEARRPADESVCFEQPPHLTFAPSDVATVEAGPRGRLRLAQYGFGMFGPNGALPFHLTEFVFERRRHHEDAAVSDFINLFQQRLTALFYRAWADSDPVACHSRPDDDDFAAFLGALIGLFDESARNRDSTPDYAKLCRVGQVGSGSKSADGLEAILSDYFRQKIEVREFVGSWLRIPEELHTRLGATDDSAVLGRSATLGAQSWQRQGKFEVVIGPMPFEAFLRFLPGSRALRALADLIRFYTTGEWTWQVRLLVEKGDAPSIALGQVGRLGWTSWLGRKLDAAADVVLRDEQAMTV